MLGGSSDAVITLELLETVRPQLDALSAAMTRFHNQQNAANRMSMAALARYNSQYSTLVRTMGTAATAARAFGSTLFDVFNRALGPMMRWGAAIGTIVTGGGILAFSKQLVVLNANMERYEVTLRTVLKSQARATDTMQWIIRFAEKTPFQIEGLVGMAARLESFGLSAKKWAPIAGNISSAFGADLQTAEEVVQAIAYISSGLTGRGMMSLRRFGISNQMMEAHGVRFSTQGEMLTPRSVNLGAIEAIQRERFPGLMEEQARTMYGVMSNLADITTQTMRTIGLPAFESIRGSMVGVYEQLDAAVESGQLTAWAKNVGRLLGDAVHDALSIADSAIQHGVLTGSLSEAISAGWAGASPVIHEMATHFGYWAAEAFSTLAAGVIQHPVGMAVAGYAGMKALAAAGAGRGMIGIGRAAYGALGAMSAGTLVSTGGMLALTMGVPAMVAAGAYAGSLGIDAYADYRYSRDMSPLQRPLPAWSEGRGHRDQFDVLYERRMMDILNAGIGQRTAMSHFVSGSGDRRRTLATLLGEGNLDTLKRLSEDPVFRRGLIADQLVGANQRLSLAGGELTRLSGMSAGGVLAGAMSGDMEMSAELFAATERYREALLDVNRLRKEDALLTADITANQVKLNQGVNERIVNSGKDARKTLGALSAGIGVLGSKGDLTANLAELSAEQLAIVGSSGMFTPEQMAHAYRMKAYEKALDAGFPDVAERIRQGDVWQNMGGLRGQLEGIDSQLLAQYDTAFAPLEQALTKFIADLPAAVEKAASAMLQDLEKQLGLKVTFSNALNLETIMSLKDSPETRRVLKQLIVEALSEAGYKREHAKDHESDTRVVAGAVG